MDISVISQKTGDATYAALAACALWGAFCVVVVWRRLLQLRFRDEAAQAQFLSRLETQLVERDFDAARADCEDDPRVVPQLAAMALANRDLGLARLRHLLVDRFQRDVLADLEYRLSWVQTAIKTAPMLGLFGTVLGMMAAFGKLSSGDKVEPRQLADDISLALITTAIGLAIAIPLTVCAQAINIRIRKLEDLTGLGLSRLVELLKTLTGG
jgi:biopolymer transport protein ExbB